MKLLGILLFLFAAALLTACVLAREKRKYEEAEGIYLLLLHIRRGVCEEALPLSEIYASFENQALEETPFLSLLRKEGLAEALKKAPPPFDEATLRALSLYADTLGKRFSSEEHEASERACASLFGALELYRSELPRRLKMQRTLMLTGSGMLLLLFL